MKLLFILMAALLLPVVPALACFPDDSESDGILFASEGRNFDRNPLPMSFCESDEVGFVIVNGKCYDFDAITDYDTEEECQADPVCKAYREEQKQGQDDEYLRCPADTGSGCKELKSIEEQNQEQDLERTDDPNHGEIKGDEELEQDQSEEEHQEEEEQGQAQGDSEQTTSETDE